MVKLMFFDSLHSETYGGMMVRFQRASLVQNHSLPFRMQAHHEDVHFLFAKKALEEVCKDIPMLVDKWKLEWPETSVVAGQS